MSKFRSRMIVEAVRWFPGVTIPDVMQISATEAVLDRRRSTPTISTNFCLVSAGDWVVSYPDGHRAVFHDTRFHEQFENIGG